MSDLTGGKLSLAFAGSFLKKSKYEKVIVVDGGLGCKELGIIPDVIVEILIRFTRNTCLLPENGTHYMGSVSRKKMIRIQNLPLSVLLP